MKNKNNYAKQSMPYLLLFLVICGVLVFFHLSKYKVNEFTYDALIKELSNGEVKELTITPKNGSGVYYITGSLNSYSETESFKVNVPLSETVLSRVMKYADEDNIKVTTNNNPENSGFVTVLINVVPTVLLIGATIWLFSKISGSNKNSMDFGRSKARLNEEAKAPKRRQVTLENCLGAVPIDDKKVKLIKGKLKLSKVYYNISPVMYQIGFLACILVILGLCIINFMNVKKGEQIAELDSKISAKQDLIELQEEYNTSSEELNALKSFVDKVPSGKENAATALSYIQECVNFVDGISIKDCTINSDTQVQINFATAGGVNAANAFDERLREYFDFDRTFYSPSRTEFRLDLKLKK